MSVDYDTSNTPEGDHTRRYIDHTERCRRLNEAAEHDAPLNGNLRDEFAMAALTGLLTRGAHDHDKRERRRYYDLAYEIADGMLEARKPKP